MALSIKFRMIIFQLKVTYMEPEVAAYECIVIGAGAAGIGAAYTLHQQQIPHLVLQARTRIGGRLKGGYIDGINFDLGASWIHSYTRHNPLYKFVHKFGLREASLTSYRTVRRICYDGELGKPFNQQTLDAAQYHIFDYFNTAKRNARKYNHDISIKEATEDFYNSEDHIMTEEERRCTQALINLTEHYEASSAEQLSVNHYQYRMYEGDDFLPEGTYVNLIKKLSRDLNIEINKQVVSIDRRADNIILVRCSDKSIYCCKKIIISLPLAILKSKKVEMIPELPERHQQAIDALGVGLMNKILLSFSEKFWGPSYWISIGHNERGKFPHFYDFSQHGKYLLCCFVTDDFARKMQKTSDSQIVSEIVLILKRIFGEDKVRLREAVITRWGQQEFSMGSYASFHVGSSPDDCYQLRKAVEDRMYFVGQHVYAQHIGTAHGAFQTGVWAAQDIIKKMNRINPESRRPLFIKY